LQGVAGFGAFEALRKHLSEVPLPREEKRDIDFFRNLDE